MCVTRPGSASCLKRFNRALTQGTTPAPECGSQDVTLLWSYLLPVFSQGPLEQPLHCCLFQHILFLCLACPCDSSCVICESQLPGLLPFGPPHPAGPSASMARGCDQPFMGTGHRDISCVPSFWNKWPLAGFDHHSCILGEEADWHTEAQPFANRPCVCFLSRTVSSVWRNCPWCLATVTSLTARPSVP